LEIAWLPTRPERRGRSWDESPLVSSRSWPAASAAKTTVLRANFEALVRAKGADVVRDRTEVNVRTRGLAGSSVAQHRRRIRELGAAP
jgi:hypothetical protein